MRPESTGTLSGLIRAVYGEVGYRLREGDAVIEEVAFEGPARIVPLAWPFNLMVPEHVPPSEAETGMLALLARCSGDRVELQLDGVGVCIGLLGAVHDMLGVTEEHLRDAPMNAWLRRVHPFDQRAVREAVEARRATSIVFRYRRRASDLCHYEVQIEPSDAVLHLRIRDVTEVESLRTQIDSVARRERALIDAQPDALLRIRSDGRILELLQGRSGLPDGLTPISVGGRISDALARPHGHELERLIGEVVQHSQPGLLRLDIGQHVWEARIEPAGEGQVLVLLRDVSARERLLREVVEAREKAESASREKTKFLANMSHEIRTPLHGVLGMTDLLLHTGLSPDQRELGQAIEGSGRLLLSLLNDLLDLSKIEAGQLELEQVRFDLAGLFEEALELAAHAAHAKGLALVLDVDPDLPIVAVGDPKRLRQVVVNLVSNAVKFTAEGYVAVRVRPFGDARIRVEVEDTGIGIAQEAVARLFDPFAQADASVARRFGGTGLGLAICKELVQRMDGGIGVESQLGRGSVFRFHVHLELQGGRREDDHFPLHDLAGRKVALHGLHHEVEASLIALLASWGLEVVSTEDEPEVVLARPLSEEDSVLSELPRECEVIRLVRWGEPRTGFTLRAPPRRVGLLRSLRDALGLDSPRDDLTRAAEPLFSGRVLVVDDNPINRRIMDGQLTRMGLSVVLAVGGQDGLRKAQHQDVDLILMDLQMPDMDGFETTRLLRQRGVRVPVLALTAGLASERRRCEAAGMDGYLTKPVDPRQLRSALHRWLPGHRLARRSA